MQGRTGAAQGCTVVGRKAARAAKVKKKLRVTLGGYAARVEELGKRLSKGKRGDTRDGD
jgi:hypothetical protein